MNLNVYLKLAAVLVVLFSTSANGAEVSRTVQQNIDNLIRTNSCSGCDLSGADLNRMILTGADLSNADLSGATFFLADLSDANLSGANLRDAKFGGADLAGADLRGADLRGALLDGAFLKGSIMDGKIVDSVAATPEESAEATEKVYVPDETTPKQVADHTQAAVTDGGEQDEEAVAMANAEKGSNATQPGPTEDKDTTSEPTDSAAGGTGDVTAESSVPAEPNDEVKDQPKEEPKELTDQKKKVVAPQNSEPSADNATLGSVGAPPVKKVAPVEQAVVESEAKDLAVSPKDAADPDPMVTETVVAMKPEDQEPVQEKELTEPATSAMEKAPQSELATNVEAQFIEKLLDENRCYECDLSGVDLSGKDLSGADLEGSDLSGAILNDVDLAGANLKQVNFRGAQMKKADLRRADLYKADLSNADLTDADFRGTLTDEADFTGALGYQPQLMGN